MARLDNELNAEIKRRTEMNKSTQIVRKLYTFETTKNAVFVIFLLY